jgi:hypothetical protein
VKSMWHGWCPLPGSAAYVSDAPTCIAYVLAFIQENFMRRLVRFSALALALAFAAPAFAQDIARLSTPSLASLSVPDSSQAAPDSSSQVRTDFSAAAGASVTGLRAGVHSRETARPNQPYVVTSQHMGQDKAMMVVGVAALVAGAIIGGTPGTIVMVGGAVVGLMGLYNYLQ